MRNNRYRVVLIAWLAMLVMALPARSDVLGAHEWKHRPLLIFAAHSEITEKLQLMKELEQNECYVKDRRMVIAEIYPVSGNLDGQVIPRGEVASLRKRFGIGGTDFTVVLLGYDGYEKYRSSTQPDLQVIFSLIDTMPMRQDEMSIRPESC